MISVEDDPHALFPHGVAPRRLARVARSRSLARRKSKHICAAPGARPERPSGASPSPGGDFAGPGPGRRGVRPGRHVDRENHHLHERQRHVGQRVRDPDRRLQAAQHLPERQGLKPDGPAMTIYTSTDDTGFSFQAAIPLAEEPQNPPRGDIAIGKSPAGHALKFVHHGSYDSMDTTYEAITNYLDEKRLEAKDLFIEEYASDPVT